MVYQPQTTPVETTSNLKSLSVQEAKTWYMQQQLAKLTQPHGGTSSSFTSTSNSTSVTSTNVIPIWAKAVNSLYYGQKPIVIAPFAEPSFFKYTRYQTAYLIIFRQNDNTMNSRIMVFKADSTVQTPNPLDIQTFTGVTYQVNEHGNMGLIYKCLNGEIIAKLEKDSSALGVRDDCPGPGDCYRGWGDKNTPDWLERLGNWWRGLGGNRGSGNWDPSTTSGRNRDYLNIGVVIEESPSTGGGGSGSVPLGNMLNERNFSSVNVGQMIATCQNSDYEDMVTFGLRQSDPSMIANAPALVTFKALGHSWANSYLNAARYHYKHRLNNVDFSTALFTLVQNQNNPNFSDAYPLSINGISPYSTAAYVRAAYAPLIANYDRMMVDWSNANGNCAAFSYTTTQSFDHFKETFADNLFQELNISATGIDNERKQQAVSWLFMTDFMNPDLMKAYFEACRQYPLRMSIVPTYHFSGWYDAYANKGFSIAEFTNLFGSPGFHDADVFLDSYNFDNESRIAAKGVAILAKKNWLRGLTIDAELEEIKNAFQQEDNPILGLAIDLFVIDYKTRVAYLKKIHPDWKDYRVALEASRESLHLVLDICGIVPAWGEPCDLVNGVFYTIEGDGLNASLSFAATIPFAGWAATGAKLGVKITRVIGNSGRVYRLTYKIVGTVVEFGEKTNLRAQLRRILNTPTGSQAHHIVPLELVENSLVQKAAKDKAPFHINEFNNGISISDLYHNGSHDAYTTRVRLAMQKIYDDYGGANISPQVAQRELQKLLKDIKDAIVANPTTHINNITW